MVPETSVSFQRAGFLDQPVLESTIINIPEIFHVKRDPCAEVVYFVLWHGSERALIWDRCGMKIAG
jgi:hypothetical protein